ncbi:ankyrin repeat and zinc finger domain-containing protein 1 isoform X2 [Oryzias latipes]|uniref:ankyrin repeat and zinc finger domain-containing protein 1 isoform X2 n=1 Tax=Oryzias latipes TaxID=8090 RepID=UPI0009DAAF1B|nr:ankyrin repeat and zinc finger domain-containing protein 1 isoform X2 [Oryzias latipes]
MTTASHSRSIFDLFSNEEAFELKEVNSVLLKEDGNPTAAPDCLQDNSREDDRRTENNLPREVSDKMLCSACKCPFNTKEEQREHYKLDWHRFNLRQKIVGLHPLNVEEFEKKTGSGDLSSISGSESDSEDEGSDTKGGVITDFTGTDCGSSISLHSITGRLSSKVVLQNSTGEYLLVYRCVLQGKIDDENDAVSSLRAINKGTVWVILMTGGGHFAGAVFEGPKVLQHKTFHRYTVRAKRGTAQGLRDSQNRSHTPKSAGAALRRYNEAALVKDIQDLMLTWAEHINKASVIFVRVPSYNRSILFGGRAAPLDKKDPRIRTIPFATRRATFREVQKVHELLSTVQVYGLDTDITVVLSPSKKTWKSTVKSTVEESSDQKKEEETNVSDEEEEAEIHLETVKLTLGTLDLRESEIFPSRNKRRTKKRLKEETKNPNKEADYLERVSEATQAEESPQGTETLKEGKKEPQLDDVAEPLEYGLKDALFTACKVGDVAALGRLLQSPEDRTESFEELKSKSSTIPSPLTLLNKPVDSSGFTLLHVAAAAAQKEAVRLLLDSGADPACRDNKGQTPYIVSPDKDTRNFFRKYMGENPDKYDYRKAQVPGPLTAETESKKAEKKKAQKAQKKQREKEQKEVKKKQEQEEEERRKFASLTDREKRALAAERRLAEQAAAAGGSISNVKRCWSCGESLLEKIPFHYLEFAFCSPRCLQAHRKANVPSA